MSDKDSTDLVDLIQGVVVGNYEFFDLELNLIATDKSVIQTICFVRGLYDKSGRFTEAIITFQDITHQVRSRIALDKVKIDLE